MKSMIFYCVRDLDTLNLGMVAWTLDLSLISGVQTSLTWHDDLLLRLKSILVNNPAACCVAYFNRFKS